MHIENIPKNGIKKAPYLNYIVGNVESVPLQLGDQVKIKNSIWEITGPSVNNIKYIIVPNLELAGTRVVLNILNNKPTDDLNAFLIQAIVGMHKKSRRLVALTPEMMVGCNWINKISKNSSVIIDISVLSVKYKKSKDIEEALEREEKANPMPVITGDKLQEYFNNLELNEYLPNFRKENISFEDLNLLTTGDLEVLIPKMGPRKRFINSLDSKALQESVATSPTTSASITKPEKTENKLDKQLRSELQTKLENRPTPELNSKLTPKPVLSALDSISSEKTLEYGRSEYNRGLEDAMVAAKSRIEKLKSAATNKIEELEDEVGTLTDAITEERLKNEKLLKQLSDSEKKLENALKSQEDIISKSKEYIGKVRNSSLDAFQTGTSKIAEKIYVDFSSVIEPDRIYDGAQVLKHLKIKCKGILEDYKTNPQIFFE